MTKTRRSCPKNPNPDCHEHRWFGESRDLWADSWYRNKHHWASCCLSHESFRHSVWRLNVKVRKINRFVEKIRFFELLTVVPSPNSKDHCQTFTTDLWHHWNRHRSMATAGQETVSVWIENSRIWNTLELKQCILFRLGMVGLTKDNG